MPNGEMFELKFDLRMSADKKTADVMVYGVISSYKCPETITAKDFDMALKDARKSGAKNLYLRINSPGGNIPQAIAMRTMIINSEFAKIEEQIEGMCASAATLLLCIPGAHIKISEGSEIMIHRPTDICIGTSDDFERYAKLMQQREQDFRAMYAKHTGQSENQIKTWMDDETWFDAKGAVEAGFAHEISGEEKAVACVTPQQMAVMREIYANIPEAAMQVNDGQTAPAADPQPPVSPENPTNAAGGSTENTNSEEDTNPMANDNTPDVKDVKTMTPEELRAENPALFSSVMQSGGEEERKRLEKIDALTPIGYEEMAAKAKKDGTSAMDYHELVVKAQREKAAAFVAQRQAETASAAAIPGAASEGAGPKDAAAMSDKAAQDIAGYAKAMSKTPDGTMY